MYRETIDKPGGTNPTSHIIPSSVHSYLVYTAAEQDLGIPYQPIVVEYARSLYRGLINISKYVVCSGEPP